MAENQTICNIIDQRKQQALFNIPHSRYTPVSPYPQYRMFDLDMRRKAEVLQYNANKTNTKTNKLTKRSAYAQVLRGAGPLQKLASNAEPDTVISIVDCGTDVSFNVPSYYSNVPGPIVNLYYDKTIPLYKYSTKFESYGIENEVPQPEWQLEYISNVFFDNNNYNKLFTILIGKYVIQSAYTYNFYTPVGITVSGYMNNNRNATTTVYISAVSLEVTYSSSLITLQTIPVITGSFTDLGITTTLSQFSSSDTFSATIYVGNLNVSNLYLITQAGYVYDIKLKFTLQYSDPNNDFTFTQLGVYSNISVDKSQLSSACNITGFNISDPRQDFSLTGL